MSRSAQDITLGYDADGTPVCIPLDLLNRHTYICCSGKPKLVEHTLCELIRRWQHQRCIRYNEIL